MTINLYDGVTLTVEAGFASNPSTAIGSTTWTDISQYVRNVSTSRGRSSELEQFQAGRAGFLVDNRDRRFDPNYTSGAYYPNVIPMRRIRVRATYNAVTYDVWSGFVDDWPQQYLQPAEASVPLNATDGFKVLALSPLAESVHWYDVNTLAPLAWYRLGEQSGTVCFDSSGNSRDGTYAGGATFNSTGGLLVGSNDGAITFDGVDDRADVWWDGRMAVTVEAWFVPPTTNTGATQTIWAGSTPDRLTYARVYVTWVSATTFNVSASAAGGYTSLTITNNYTTTAEPWHVVAVFKTGTNAPDIYLNGTAASIFSSTAVGTVPATIAADGAQIGGDDAFPTSVYTSTIDEVAIYDGALSAGQILNLYAGGSVPWQGDASGTRISRYLDKAGWPSADRSIATGISTLQSVNLASSNALAVIQNVEASEQGQFYIAGNGQAIFRDRHWRFENSTAITSQGTFGDGAGELDYYDITTDGGEQFMANHVRASRNGGATVDASDPTSITTYFERINEVSGLENNSDLEVRDLATWRLGTRKNPIPRVTVLEIHPRRDPTNLYPKVLGLDIGQRLTVKRRPQNVGTALTYTVLIEGISHTIPFKGDWVTRLYLSSTDSNPALQPLILDDATYGIVDTNVLAY